MQFFNKSDQKTINRLKLDDLQEYENFCRDQGNYSSTTHEMQEDIPPKPSAGGTKMEEIHNRIGYAPKKKPSGPSTV